MLQPGEFGSTCLVKRNIDWSHKLTRHLNESLLESSLTLQTLKKNAFMAVNFFDPLSRGYNCSAHRDGEMSVQRIIARIVNTDVRDNLKKPWEPYNKDSYAMAMKRNTEQQPANVYHYHTNWPVVGTDPCKVGNFSSVMPALNDTLALNNPRAIVCFVSPGLDDIRSASANGHPLNDDARDFLAKKYGLPTCDKHKDGCGNYLKIGDVVKINASECTMISNFIWAVPVHKWTGACFGCHVGYIKCLFDQLHLYGNRIAIIKSKNQDDCNYATQKNPNAVWPGKCCHGVAEAWFLDGVHSQANEDMLESYDWNNMGDDDKEEVEENNEEDDDEFDEEDGDSAEE